jgi:hypothetical protein
MVRPKLGHIMCPSLSQTRARGGPKFGPSWALEGPELERIIGPYGEGWEQARLEVAMDPLWAHGGPKFGPMGGPRGGPSWAVEGGRGRKVITGPMCMGPL